MADKTRLEKYVEHRLLEWAEWATRGCGMNIGFATKNILASLQEMGGLLIRGNGRTILADHPPAEEIEALLNQMARQQPRRALAVKICYLCPEAPETKANKCGLKKSQYYFQLQLAHEWFVGYFSAKNGRCLK